jgi:hypothetical protein
MAAKAGFLLLWNMSLDLEINFYRISFHESFVNTHEKILFKEFILMNLHKI